jgi:ATP-binding cassette subfamily F protein uup
MSRPIYYIKDGKLSFGDKLIFTDLELYIYNKDKICLTGCNGAGKSSFLKIMTDIYLLDSGEIYKHPNLSIAYLKQEAQINNEEKFEDLLPYLSKSLDHKEVEIILRALEIPSDRPLNLLSGGQQRRAALALALIQTPDILLLDEPTNHLDIIAIEWLEQYIINYPNAVICISHDRSFLNNVTNKIWWLDRCTMRSSDKGFKYFDQWREIIITQEEAELIKLNKKLDAENLWLQQGVTARRKRNQGRLGHLKNLRNEITQKKVMQKSLHNKIAAITSAQKKSKFIIEALDLSFGYDNQNLVTNFNIRVIKGERIGIIGPNGAGKSTLIKLLLKELEPSGGRVKHGDGLIITYLDQHRDGMKGDLTLSELLCSGGGDHVALSNGQLIHVGAYLKKFMFDPKLMHAKIATLSGGQCNRLLLAKALIKPGNLLILDEPTNDLDMDSLEMLLEILYDYDGTIIIVSHDRDFINRLVTRSLIFSTDGILDVVGGVDDYSQFITNDKQIRDKKTPTKNYSNNKVVKLSYNEQRKLELNPLEIGKLEELKVAMEHRLASDSNLYLDNYNEFKKITDELLLIAEKINILTEEWCVINDKLSVINAVNKDNNNKDEIG